MLSSFTDNFVCRQHPGVLSIVFFSGLFLRKLKRAMYVVCDRSSRAPRVHALFGCNALFLWADAKMMKIMKETR